MLRTFTGFKGSIAFAELGGIRFVLMAKTNNQLELLWQSILTAAGPLDPAGIKKAILIEAATLPPARSAQSAKSDQSEPTPTGSHNSAQGRRASPSRAPTLGNPPTNHPNPEGVAHSAIDV